MKKQLPFDFSVDKETNAIHVIREFAAPLSRVWSAWTEKELLDKWWAPKPWQARTKIMDFREGGFWLYAMVGPDGASQYCRNDYKSINHHNAFSARDAFCNETGVVDTSFPQGDWTIRFKPKAETTLVEIVIRYDQPSGLEKILEMGMKEGFTAGLENLDSLLAEPSH